MSLVRKTITLTEQPDLWVQAHTNADHYTSDSEYIRDLTRREQERSQAVESIRAAPIEGEASGEPRASDPQVFKRKMRTNRG